MDAFSNNIGVLRSEQQEQPVTTSDRNLGKQESGSGLEKWSGHGSRRGQTRGKAYAALWGERMYDNEMSFYFYFLVLIFFLDRGWKDGVPLELSPGI